MDISCVSVIVGEILAGLCNTRTCVHRLAQNHVGVAALLFVYSLFLISRGAIAGGV